MSGKRTPYSSKVILRLAIGGQTLVLAQDGPDFIVLRDVPTLSQLSGNARVDVIIDNRVATSKTVFLPHGIEDGTRRVSYF